MTDDQELLAELGALLRRFDPVPATVCAAAEAAFAVAVPRDWTWLERLPEPVLVRSAARTLRFGDNEISLHVELHRSHLTGLVSPVLDVELLWPNGSQWVRPDAAGYFRVPDPPRGPLRLVVGETRATRWFLS